MNTLVENYTSIDSARVLFASSRVSTLHKKHLEREEFYPVLCIDHTLWFYVHTFVREPNSHRSMDPYVLSYPAPAMLSFSWYFLRGDGMPCNGNTRLHVAFPFSCRDVSTKLLYFPYSRISKHSVINLHDIFHLL